jgi:hypothetical protein
MGEKIDKVILALIAGIAIYNLDKYNHPLAYKISTGAILFWIIYGWVKNNI